MTDENKDICPETPENPDLPETPEAAPEEPKEVVSWYTVSYTHLTLPTIA